MARIENNFFMEALDQMATNPKHADLIAKVKEAYSLCEGSFGKMAGAAALGSALTLGGQAAYPHIKQAVSDYAEQDYQNKMSEVIDQYQSQIPDLFKLSEGGVDLAKSRWTFHPVDSLGKFNGSNLLSELTPDVIAGIPANIAIKIANDIDQDGTHKLGYWVSIDNPELVYSNMDNSLYRLKAYADDGEFEDVVTVKADCGIQTALNVDEQFSDAKENSITETHSFDDDDEGRFDAQLNYSASNAGSPDHYTE